MCFHEFLALVDGLPLSAGMIGRRPAGPNPVVRNPELSSVATVDHRTGLAKRHHAPVNLFALVEKRDHITRRDPGLQTINVVHHLLITPFGDLP